jgi:hypothetical protein
MVQKCRGFGVGVNRLTAPWSTGSAAAQRGTKSRATFAVVRSRGVYVLASFRAWTILLTATFRASTTSWRRVPTSYCIGSMNFDVQCAPARVGPRGVVRDGSGTLQSIVMTRGLAGRIRYPPGGCGGQNVPPLGGLIIGFTLDCTCARYSLSARTRRGVRAEGTSVSSAASSRAIVAMCSRGLMSNVESVDFSMMRMLLSAWARDSSRSDRVLRCSLWCLAASRLSDSRLNRPDSSARRDECMAARLLAPPNDG